LVIDGQEVIRTVDGLGLTRPKEALLALKRLRGATQVSPALEWRGKTRELICPPH
jgi:hypothetical protein